MLTNKYGDCKDKLALLAALATAVGLEVRPVLVHSERKALVEGAPGPQQFDHMIGVARLGTDPKDWLWLDATNELGRPGYLRPAIRDKPALIIEAAGMGRLVRTPERAPFPQRVEVDMKGSLQADGPLRAHVRWTFRSDSEVDMRFGYRVTPQDRHAELVKNTLAEAWKDATVTNVATSDASDITTPFRVEFDVELVPPGRSAESEWALSLPLPDFQLPAPRKKAEGDQKAVALTLDEFDARAEIELPAGAVGRAPLSLSLDRPFAQLHSDYAVEGSLLKARRRLVLLKRSVAANESATYESFRQAVEEGPRAGFLDPARPRAVRIVVFGRGPPQGWARRLCQEGVRKGGRRIREGGGRGRRLVDGYNDLGRALRHAGRRRTPIKAFARQIEVDPFHESAYAERAYTLLDMDRSDEAEKDLLKQIEVAPLKAWSHERLAETPHGQHASTRPSATSPRHRPGAKDAENWTSWVGARDCAPPARPAALARARALDPPYWVAVRLAVGLHAPVTWPPPA